MIIDSKHLNRLFENTNDNIHSVKYSYKIVNGLITNQLCIQYDVKKKKILSELNEEEIIPYEVIIDGKTYKTDVVEVPIPTTICSISGDPTTNQIYRRPILGGTQIQKPNCGTGTLGFIAVDNYDNSLVGVTNLHVIACTSPYESQYLNYVGFYGNLGSQYWFNNPYSLVNYNNPEVFQNEINSQKVIGVVKRSYMLKPYLCSGGTPSLECINYIDAALLTLRSSAVTNSESWKQIGLTGLTTAPTFATTGEIDSLLSTKNPLYSTGRTTGAKGEGFSQIYVYSVGVGTVGYNVPGNQKQSVSYFNDLLYVVASGSSTPAGTICSDVVRPGDSGSMIYAFFDGIPKIVGLVFAASSEFLNEPWSLGLICRIDRIASMLNISAWTGDSRSFIDNPTTSVYQVSTLSTPLTLFLSGNTYWQAGSHNINVNKNMGTYYKFIPNL